MAAEGAGCHRLGGHDREAHRRRHALEEDVRVTVFPYSWVTRLLKDSTVIPSTRGETVAAISVCMYIYIYVCIIYGYL